MKPSQWILLGLLAAACRSTDSAALREQARGPGSRVVIPDVAQPRAAEPAPVSAEPELALQVPPESAAGGAPAESGSVPAASGESPASAAQLEQPEVRSGTAGDPPAQPSEPAPPAAPGLPEDEAKSLAALDDPEYAAAVAALLARDPVLAKQHVDLIVARPSLDKAARLSAAGEHAAAIAEIEEVLRTNSGRADLLEAAGNAALALGEAGDRARLAYARESFLQAGSTPTALLGRSRAARLMGLWDEALDCARQALVLLSVRPRAERLELVPAAEVVLADAGMDVLRGLRSQSGAAATALAAELESALSSRIREQGSDAMAHARLAALYLDQGKVFEALAAAESGLGFSPADAELAKLLARAALSAGGANEVIAAFGRLSKRFPTQALLYWYPALERFKSAVSGVVLNPRDTLWRQLQQAMAGFAECRRLDARYEKSCLEYEALCLGVRGWELFADDRLEPARLTFLSMDTSLPGGIALDPAGVDPQLQGRLSDGLSGLARIAERYRDVKKDSPAAAAVFSDLARVAPKNALYVRAAAQSAELAAEDLEQLALEFESAREGKLQDSARLRALRKLAGVSDRAVGSDKEAERFAAAAADRRKRAAESYANSWQSYLAAVELEPQDARLACDAARVAVYCTKSDPARAEELLRRAIRLAQEQSLVTGLSPSALSALERTWGDALVHLGVFELESKHDPRAARQYFEQSLEVGSTPIPRHYVREVLLPQAIEASKQLRENPPATTSNEN